jgi:glycosyltransferase involved in cell wall biosynthesis
LLECCDRQDRGADMLTGMPSETLFEKKKLRSNAQVTVAVSCFNYGREGTEALGSLLAQTEKTIDVVVVDDHSPDDSAEVLREWFRENGEADKFSNTHLVRHLQNQGLSYSRNTALSFVQTPYVFILDADNQLYPRALQVLREALENSGYAMAYSLIERFGVQHIIANNSIWLPEKFSHGNYIDAMALIKTGVLRDLGGYRTMPDKFGWEDYDLWCSFVDHDLKGCYVPQILCRYRVHDRSMTETQTRPFLDSELQRIREYFKSHHTMPFYF